MRCFKCLKEVPAKTEVCPHCGQALVPKTEKPKKAEEASPVLQPKIKEYQIGDTIKSRYEVRDILGRKGIGHTYKVRDKEKKKIFILKEIKPFLFLSEDAKARFFDTIKTIVGLNLPEVAAINDYGEDDGIVYIVSEYIEGLTLKKLLDVRKEMKQFFKGEELESILTHICKTLITAHNNGIVHGDLKPENIFILPSGLKITELGITGTLSPLDFTSIQQDLGNAYKYIAPEVIIGRALSKSGDIYSLGVIVYEMLTGIIPGGVVNPPSTYNSELPHGINEILLKALQQDHDLRTQYVVQFYQELLNVFGQKAQAFDEKAWAQKTPVETEQTGTLKTEIDEELAGYMEAGEIAKQPLQEQQAEKKEEPEPEKTQSAPTLVQPSAQEESKEEPEVIIPHEETKIEQIPEQPVLAKEPKVSSMPEELNKEFIEEKAETVQTEQKSEQKAEEEQTPQATKPQEIIAEQPQLETGHSETHAEPEKAEGIDEIAKHLETITDEIQGKTVQKTKPPEPPEPQAPPVRKVEVSYPSSPVVSELKTKEKSPVGMIVIILSVVVIGAAAFIWFLLKPSGQQTKSASVSPSPLQQKEKTPAPPPPVPQPQAVEQKPATPEVKPSAPRPSTTREEIKMRREERRRAAMAAKPAPVPKCPDGMVYVSGGNFIMGSSASDPLRDFSERADVRTYVKSFCIDKYEYPGQEGTSPKSNVSYNTAERLCSNEDKRLCSEEEWEKACKGPSELKYPYGNVWNANKCDTQNKDGTSRSIVPSGSYKACASGFGIFDMSGNVMEWTSSVFSPQDTSDKVVKGGSFKQPDWATRCAYRYNMLPGSTASDVGFRCCKKPAR